MLYWTHNSKQNSIMGRWKKREVGRSVEQMRAWSLTEKGQEYRKRHAEYAREWRKKNRDKFKDTQKRAYNKMRLDVLTHYSGGKVPFCKCCGETEVLFLHIDHTDGNGAAQRRQLQKELGYYPAGNNLPYWLKKNGYPAGFQVLCANCNLAKRVDKVCPHQLAKVK